MSYGSNDANRVTMANRIIEWQSKDTETRRHLDIDIRIVRVKKGWTNGNKGKRRHRRWEFKWAAFERHGRRYYRIRAIKTEPCNKPTIADRM